MNYSVIIPAYNAEATLERTLASIKQQTFRVSEVVLVNDGSTDGTRSIAERWLNRLPLIIVDQSKNRGLTQALIDGVTASKCDWILRIDSDDFWDSNHVKIIDELRCNSNAVLISTQTRFVDVDGNLISFTGAPNPKRIRAKLMFGNHMCHSAVAFSKKAYHKAGGYRLSVKWEDYDLWIRLLSVGDFQTTSTVTVSNLIRSNSIYHSTDLRARQLADIHCNLLAIKLFWTQHPLQAIRRILSLGIHKFSLSFKQK